MLGGWRDGNDETFTWKGYEVEYQRIIPGTHFCLCIFVAILCCYEVWPPWETDESPGPHGIEGTARGWKIMVIAHWHFLNICKYGVLLLLYLAFVLYYRSTHKSFQLSA